MGDILGLRALPHDDAQLLLPWYVTGRADAADQAAVERHLASCAACRDDLAIERQLYGLIARRSVDGARTSDRVRSAGMGSRWAPIGRAAAAVLLFAALVPSGSPTKPYRTLGEPSVAAAGDVLVVFREGTDEHDRRALLERSGARSIYDPTAAGAYLIEIAPDRETGALALLRAQSSVVLAEPIDRDEPR